MAGIFAGENVNMGRQLEVDMARVLAIVTMVFIHVFEIVETQLEFEEWFHYVLEFAGGPLSAPVFMTAMGIGIAYSRRQEAPLFASRGVTLIAQGYLLNLLRHGILFVAAYVVYNDSEYLGRVVSGMLELDILQFAGAAFLLFALMKRLNATDRQIMAVAVAMLAIAGVVTPTVQESAALSGIVGYFFFQNPSTSFPLFSWFIYPAAGYCFGKCLLRVMDKRRFYAGLLACSALGFAAYTALLRAFGYDVAGIFMLDSYYRQTLVTASWILLIFGILCSLLYYCSLFIKGDGTRSLIAFISGKVNAIYMTQWVLIMWVYTFVFRDMPMKAPFFLLLASAATALSVALVYIKTRLFDRRKAKNMATSRSP